MLLVEKKYLFLSVIALATIILVSVAIVPKKPPASGDEKLVTAIKLSAIFFGDSYTIGTGATSLNSRWSSLVSKTEGWKEINLDRGGTGYFSAASLQGCGRQSCPNYSGMLLSAANGVTPDIIVIAGGQNDFATYSKTPQPVIDAVILMYNSARAQYPRARIISVGPSLPSKISPAFVSFAEVVKDAASAVDAQYISLIDPDVILPTMVTPDGGHVDDVGHAAIAERIIGALKL